MNNKNIKEIEFNACNICEISLTYYENLFSFIKEKIFECALNGNYKYKFKIIDICEESGITLNDYNVMAKFMVQYFEKKLNFRVLYDGINYEISWL